MLFGCCWLLYEVVCCCVLVALVRCRLLLFCACDCVGGCCGSVLWLSLVLQRFVVVAIGVVVVCCDWAAACRACWLVMVVGVVVVVVISCWVVSRVVVSLFVARC